MLLFIDLTLFIVYCLNHSYNINTLSIMICLFHHDGCGFNQTKIKLANIYFASSIKNMYYGDNLFVYDCVYYNNIIRTDIVIQIILLSYPAQN